MVRCVAHSTARLTVNRKYLNHYLDRPGPFTDGDVPFGEFLKERVSTMKVL
jgi:hypothetical protein